MRRWLAALVVCVLAVTIGGPAPTGAQTAPAPGVLVAEPDLSIPLRDVVPFGATAAGEVWGFGATAGGGFRIAVRRGQAWQLQPPVSAATAPLASFQAAGPAAAPQHAGELSSDGTGVLLGTAAGSGGARTQVVLGRRAGAGFTQLPAPPDDVLLPSERLFDGARIAVAAVDGAILLAPAGGEVEDGVLRWDGETWTREPVQPPAGGFGGRLKILALAASAATDAWLLAEPAPQTGRAVALYRRVAGPEPHWVEVALDATPLLARAAADAGIGALRAVAPPGDPLTVTAGHLWIDLHVTDVSGTETDATLHLTTSEQGARLDGSWCDVERPGGAPLCGAPLGADLQTARGTRSVARAVSGQRLGARVVAGAARPDGVTTGGGALMLDGERFIWGPGAGDDGDDGTQALALVDAAEGWLGGDVGATHLTRAPDGTQLAAWATPWVEDLVDVAAEPVAATSPPPTSPGSVPSPPGSSASAQALVASRHLVVLHYAPASGWHYEPLALDGPDVELPAIRAIAWPRADLAVAVGDGGGIYERRPASAVGLVGGLGGASTALWTPSRGIADADLLDVAFDPADAQRGYVVGRDGTVLRYAAGNWLAERLPGDGADADVYAVAFAGRDALIATARGLLVNDGSGWKRDARLGNERVGTVAGLPDGGATVDGRFVRERAGDPWREVDAPPLEIAAVAAYRDEAGALRSIVSTTGRPVLDSGPPPAAAAQPAQTGFVLREDAAGWHDEQHQAFRRSGTADLPLEVDPVRAFALDENGSGWAVGGTAGPSPFGITEPGSDGAPPEPARAPPRAPSAEVYRYRPAIAQPGSGTAPVPLPGGVVRFAIGGHAACLEHCAGLAGQGIAPDVLLDDALRLAGSLAGLEHGPRALLFAGGRAAGGLDAQDAERYRSRLASAGLPVFPALGPGDGRPVFASAFAGFGSPLGGGPLPAGFTTDGLPALPPPAGGARTFYAVDSSGAGGVVRVVVVDLAGGSLRDADARQEAWLRAVLADARAKRTPTIVVGARPLDDTLGPGVPGDAGRLARLLADERAAAYVSGAADDDPSSADFGGLIAAGRVPNGSDADASIPAFTTSTLGHKPPPDRSQLAPDLSATPARPTLRAPSLTLLEIEADTRPPEADTRPLIPRPRVSARQIPLLRGLSISVETRVFRHELAFVNAVGREPDRGGYLARRGEDAAVASRGDPLLGFPLSTCLSLACDDGVQLEARFESSDPQIGYFVRPGPDDRDVERGPDGLPIASDSYPLFCPQRNGTVTLTVRSGGLSASQTVQVIDPLPRPEAGPRQRPGQQPRPQTVCSFGLSPDDPRSPEALAPAAAEIAPGPAAPVEPPAKPIAPDRPPGAPPQPTGQPPVGVDAPVQQPPAPQAPVTPGPKAPASGSPPNITGGGAPQPVQQPLPTAQLVASVTPVTQVAPRREEQAAPESEHAAVRYVPGGGNALPPAGVVILAIALAAGAGAAVARSRGAADVVAPEFDSDARKGLGMP